MMTFKGTKEWWKEKLASLETNVWLSRIAEHTPTNVKLMLVSERPPTPTQLLESLAWVDTNDPRVLVFLTEPNRKEESVEKTLFVYTASASDYHGGLNARKRSMIAEVGRPHDEGLKSMIKKLDLNPKGEYRTLFTVPFDNDFGGDVMDVKALVILARMALMIWLGDVGKRFQLPIKDLNLWKQGNIKYIGLSQDNPLARNPN